MKICPACSREYPAERTHCERDGVMLVALTTGASGRTEDLIGKTIDGRYLIERVVGKGGMGTVYACRHVVVGKSFAMKVVNVGTEQTGDVLQRFIREAQTANSVHSRHIVEMTDFGQLPSGQFYMTMELLEGMDLGKALKQGLGNAHLLHVFIQCAEALEQTHQRGIIHRDLKPDNIFLVREDNDPYFVKLLDFGIAKALHGGGPSGLTETGVVLGTPYYMSPEQARGAQLDHRTDIYSLGVIMYRAFAGKLPFMADSAVGVLTRHLTEAPELPSRVGGVEPMTERVILTCLEKRPESRYPSMAALAQALRAIQSGQRPVFAVRDDPTAQDRGLPTDASLSGAMRAYGHDARGPMPSQPRLPAQTGGYGAPSPGQNSPYAPPPALSASQANPVVSPYAPPPPLSASQQNAAVANPYAQAPAPSPSQPGGQRPVSYQGVASGPYPAAQGVTAGQRPVSYQGLASGPYAPAQPQGTASGPYAAAAPQGTASGPYAAAQPLAGSQPNAAVSAPYGAPAAPGQSGPVSQQPGGPEWTAAHGLAASQAMQAQQPRKKWPFVAGGIGLLAASAAISFTMISLSRPPASDGTAAGAQPATSASASSTASSTAEAPAASAASSGAPAGTASATATAAASGSGPAPKMTGAAPKASASTSSSASTTTKRPEIRSPFD